jgi:hypothetical protein
MSASKSSLSISNVQLFSNDRTPLQRSDDAWLMKQKNTSTQDL